MGTVRLSFGQKVLLKFTFAMLLLLGIRAGAQKKFILTDRETRREYHRNDSLSAVKFLDSLAAGAYFYTKVVHVEKQGQTTRILFDKGVSSQTAKVRVSDSLAARLNLPTAFKTENLDSLKHAVNRTFTDDGYPFNRVKTTIKEQENGIPTVQLEVNPGKRRAIDALVIRDYEKLPKPFLNKLKKQLAGTVYTEKNLGFLSRELENNAFFTLTRPPQTRFTADSTQIYLFLKKKNTNTFDGIIGFGNNEAKKFTFNGNINVALRNVFNRFETMALRWQRSAGAQNFNLNVEVPYLFNSRLGTAIDVEIYKQDSLFASAKFRPSVFYTFSSRYKMGLRGTFSTSAGLDGGFSALSEDYGKSGAGLWAEYLDPSEIPLFQAKKWLRAEADVLTTTYAGTRREQQSQFAIKGAMNLHLAGSHWLNLAGEGAATFSAAPLAVNELYRFGGSKSLLGFAENSLLADSYVFGGPEYRYLVGEKAFLDLFLQYGMLSNKNLRISPTLISFGGGMHFMLPVGLMSLQISNGHQSGTPFKLSGTVIHWGLLSTF